MKSLNRDNQKRLINPLHQIKELWKYFTPARKRSYFFLVLLMIAAAIAELVSIGAILPFLAVLTSPESITSLPYIGQYLYFDNTNDLVLLATIVFASAAVMSGIVRLFLLRHLTNLSFRTGTEIATLAYSKALNRPYQSHVLSNSSELISTITGKTHSAIFTTLIPCLTIISSIFILSIISSALIFFDPVIALSAILVIGLTYSVVSIFSRRKLVQGSMVIAKKNDEVIRILQESLGGIREIIIDNTHNLYVKSFKDIDYEFRMAQSSRTIIGQSPRYWMEAIGMVLIAAFSYYLAMTSESFTSVVPILGTIALAAQRMLPVMQLAYASWANIQSGSYSIEDILDILKEDNMLAAEDDIENSFLFQKEITLNDVNFYYQDSKEPTLKNINLTINKGQKIGIVGETGSGKSTLMDIMMGLLVPSSGSIYIDSKEINKSNMKLWQSNISHVSQSIFLIDASVNENIAFGVSSNEIDNDLISSASKSSESYDFISKMQDGFDSKVGERGTQLSGGQLQRIGIARALYKRKEVLFFDEATSALDLMTEDKIMNNIYDYEDSITMVMIAHRMETLKNCDFIIEMHDGEIKSIVSYNDLKSR